MKAVSPPLSQPLLSRMTDFCANRARRMTLSLSSTDQNGTTIGPVIQAADANLSEVQFPALDSPSAGPRRVVFVFAPAHTQVGVNGAGSNPTSTPSGMVKRALCSTFRVTRAGLDTSRVSGTDAFTTRRAIERLSSDHRTILSSLQFKNAGLTRPIAPQRRVRITFLDMNGAPETITLTLHDG